MFFLLQKRARRYQESGFTLVETLVAITILLVVIVGPMTIAQKGIQNSYFAGDQTTAVYLAQEAIEHIQRLRDDVALDNFQDYKNSNSNPGSGETRAWHSALDSDCTDGEGCDVNLASTNSFTDCSSESNCTLNFQNDQSSRIYGYGAGPDSKFIRKIFVGNFDAQGGVPVTVTVRFGAAIFGTGSTRTVTLQTYIYDHYERFE
jgi:prepilin-type N-terminal cleavage/methylation domain-containing protein